MYMVNYKCGAWYKVTLWWWHGVSRSDVIWQLHRRLLSKRLHLHYTCVLINAGYDDDRLFKIIPHQFVQHTMVAAHIPLFACTGTFACNSSFIRRIIHAFVHRIPFYPSLSPVCHLSSPFIMISHSSHIPPVLNHIFPFHLVRTYSIPLLSHILFHITLFYY